MHFLDFFSIVERDIELLNPSSPEKLERLARYCDLKGGDKVLDIASGKGFMLRKWAKDYGVQGIGLELNPNFNTYAIEQSEKENLTELLTFVEGPALDFKTDPNRFDVVTCIGASFAIGSFEDAVIWMKKHMKPDGVMALGEVYVDHIPFDIAHKEITDISSYLKLETINEILSKHDLSLIAMIGSSQDDWDNYVCSSWDTAYNWALAHPSHPNRNEVIKMVAEGKQRYLRWARQYEKWAIFIAKFAL